MDLPESAILGLDAVLLDMIRGKMILTKQQNLIQQMRKLYSKKKTSNITG